MKKSDHKVTFDDALAFLSLNGISYPVAIGEHLWPDKAGYGPSRGGPSSAAVAASWMLGKMRRAGLVEQQYGRDGWTLGWQITPKGEERLRLKHQ